jgi:DNA-binding CsgD family transcriptional regulator
MDPEAKNLSAAAYGRNVFGMFGRETTTVRMRFHKNLAGVVIDRFGQDTMLIPDGDEHFIFSMDIAVSPLFLGWLAGFGLLFGRLGDAAGTGLYMLLQVLLPGNTVVLITAAALLFIISVFVFFQLYQRLYAPTLIRQRSEQEVFELFAKKHDLTGRERTILRMVLEGQSNGQIAEQLFLTESTVKYHIHNLLQKTACKNRRELMQQYTEDRGEE